MTRREDLIDMVERAAREIERDVGLLRTMRDESGARSLHETIRAVASRLAYSSDELTRLNSESDLPEADDEALLERIQARFDRLPRNGSVVDELIAERRAEARQDEVDSDDR